MNAFQLTDTKIKTLLKQIKIEPSKFRKIWMWVYKIEQKKEKRKQFNLDYTKNKKGKKRRSDEYQIAWTETEQERIRKRSEVGHINAQCRLKMYLPGMGACVWWSNEGREGKGRCRFGDFGGLEILSVVLIVLLVVWGVWISVAQRILLTISCDILINNLIPSASNYKIDLGSYFTKKQEKKMFHGRKKYLI